MSPPPQIVPQNLVKFQPQTHALNLWPQLLDLIDVVYLHGRPGNDIHLSTFKARPPTCQEHIEKRELCDVGNISQSPVHVLLQILSKRANAVAQGFHLYFNKMTDIVKMMPCSIWRRMETNEIFFVQNADGDVRKAWVVRPLVFCSPHLLKLWTLNDFFRNPAVIHDELMTLFLELSVSGPGAPLVSDRF